MRLTSQLAMKPTQHKLLVLKRVGYEATLKENNQKIWETMSTSTRNGKYSSIKICRYRGKLSCFLKPYLAKSSEVIFNYRLIQA